MRNLFLALSILALLGAIYCFLWIMSSSSLAHMYCKAHGGFDLFHKEFRCRQPYIAMLLTGFFVLLGFCSFRQWHKSKNRKDSNDV